VRLSNEPHEVWDFGDGRHAHFHVPIAPPAQAGHVLADAFGIVDLGERQVQVQAQSKPLGLGDDIDEVGFRLIRHVQLQELLSHARVQGQDLFAELIENGGKAVLRVDNAQFADPYEYTGRPFDDWTGLQNNRARWLNPTTGRFMSEDPIGYAGGDTNL
jgi:RHS repeat-associated protein